MLNEAVYALHEGVGTVASIDTALKLGANHPMGPLELADFIGLDTCLAVMQVIQEGMSDCKYRPCPLLVKYVEAGWLGRKSGRGFYDYTATLQFRPGSRRIPGSGRHGRLRGIHDPALRPCGLRAPRTSAWPMGRPPPHPAAPCCKEIRLQTRSGGGPSRIRAGCGSRRRRPAR